MRTGGRDSERLPLEAKFSLEGWEVVLSKLGWGALKLEAGGGMATAGWKINSLFSEMRAF